MEVEVAYREIAPKLQSYLTGNGCSHALACDIVQETFLRLWKQRESLEDDLSRVSGLAFTIARNYRNDLARKARHEVLGDGSDDERPDGEGEVSTHEVARPGEEAEETAALRRRLASTLARMPAQLLETFALSRLGGLSVRDIAAGTGVSESNVKVRVHRARAMFMACYKAQDEACAGAGGSSVFALALLRATMMLAAVDGEIAKEELALYRKLAEEFRGPTAAAFEAQWEQAVRDMAYIGFLSEIVPPDELVREFVRQTLAVFADAGRIENRRVIAVLERMAAADGDYSRIERQCVAALAGALR